MLWLIPIAAFFVYSLYLGRNTYRYRSYENAAKARINDALFDSALAHVRNRELEEMEQRIRLYQNADVPVPSQQTTQTPEKAAFEKAAFLLCCDRLYQEHKEGRERTGRMNEEREDSFAVALLDPDVIEGHQRYLEQEAGRRRREARVLAGKGEW